MLPGRHIMSNSITCIVRHITCTCVEPSGTESDIRQILQRNCMGSCNEQFSVHILFCKGNAKVYFFHFEQHLFFIRLYKNCLYGILLEYSLPKKCFSLPFHLQILKWPGSTGKTNYSPIFKKSILKSEKKHFWGSVLPNHTQVDCCNTISNNTISRC